MLERALDAGVPAAWVTGDEVYGNDPALRGWLEQRGVSHVLVVKRSAPLVAAGAYGPVRSTAKELAATVAGERWLRCNAGFGAKGRRWYDWTQVPLVGSGASGRARWLLVRRGIDDPSQLAFYVCWGPAATALISLVRVAGPGGGWRCVNHSALIYADGLHDLGSR